MLPMLVQPALYPQSIFPTSTLEILKLLSLLPPSSLPVDAEGTPSLESAEVPPLSQVLFSISPSKCSFLE